MTGCWVPCLTTLLIFTLSSATDTPQSVKKFVDSDLRCNEEVQKIIESNSYDKLDTPFPEDGTPLNLYAGIYTAGLSSLNTVTMSQFRTSTSIFIWLLALRWVDRRLTYNCGINASSDIFTMFTSSYVDKFWIPGLYFGNSHHIRLHEVMTKNAVLKIWPDGHVRSSTRVTMKVICNMQLGPYPFDTQHCETKFMDYSFPNTLVNISWMPDYMEPAVGMSKNIKFPEMEITAVKAGYCDGTYNSGVWSCLALKITLKRITVFHLYQTYLPSALIVLISFTNFWLDVDALPGRIMLSITSLLTLTTQTGSLRLALPSVSYLKAVDIWMITCQLFILAALLEFMLVNYVFRRYKAIERKHNVAAFVPMKTRRQAFVNDNEESTRKAVAENVLFSVRKSKKIDQQAQQFEMKCRQQGRNIDTGARVLFPVLFLIFNIVYWSYFITK